MYKLLALAAAVASPARADLPVHCLRHQVAGDWEFKLGPLGSERTSCGHHRPDDQNKQPSLDSVAAQGGTSTVKFKLANPSTVTAEDGASGTWTMIYDEGFEVAVGGQVFFAFSNFELVDDDSGSGSKTNISHCDATQVGWYHNTDRTQWGCYLGKKVGGGAPSGAAAEGSSQEDAPPAAPRAPAAKKKIASMSALLSSAQSFLGPSDDDDEDEDVEVTADEADATKLPAGYQAWVPGSAGYDNPMPTEWQKSVADALNFLQLGWTATVHRMFQGKSPRELNKIAGVRRSRPKSAAKQVPDESSSFSSFLGLTSKVSRERENFDWRRKDGQNWMTPVVTQGDCGSCYTISTVHMLTARHRIKTGDASKPPFSVSFPLYCSEYNQGCDGGYGFLQSKWSEDVGLVPESCSAFSQGGGSCKALKDCDLGSTRFRAHNHHYVGGYYGASEEKVIRQELVNNGPVVMSFEPKEDFMYYKAGVYRSSPNKIHQEWEQVDHAVLLIGYGKDEGQKYWTMQNSWGTDWGEAGYFRMARGSDESGCESIVVAAEVIEENSNNVLDNFLAQLQ